MTDTAVARYAVGYAGDLGWSVLPVWWVNDDGTCGCGDVECAHIGKHPLGALVPRGALDASSNPTVVASWWDAFPNANVAVACDQSGLVVLDVDPRNGGDESLEFIERSVAEAPYTLQAATGGGGRHLFYRAPPGLKARGKLGRGVDVKHAGYVLLPPSGHVSGGTYAWATTDVAPQELTPEFLELVVASTNGSTSVTFGVPQGNAPMDITPLFTGELGPGERHEFFKSYAGSLRARRWRREEALAWVADRWADVQQDEHPFPLDEALALVAWVYDNRPEGTPQERQLEGYRDWIETYGTPSLQSEAAGTGSRIDTVSTEFDVNAEILKLPEPLRDAVLARLLNEEAADHVRGIRARAEFVPPASRVSLADELSINDPPLPWTIQDLWIANSNVTLVAMYKTGKTVFHLNLAQCLCDGEPFLGRFAVRPIAGRVGIVNAELDEALWRDWARRVGFTRPDKASVLHLRGYRVDVSTDVGREWLARWCIERDIEILLLDPFVRLHYGDENSATDVKKWTDAIDVLKREANVKDAHVAVHAGRISERLEIDERPRARGSTRLDDWPDALWTLMRDDRANDAPRYLAVEGRRVSLEETELAYDEDSLRLEVAAFGGSRRVQRSLAGVDTVTRVLEEAGARDEATGMTKGRLRTAIGGHATEADAAIERAVRLGRVVIAPGPNRSQLHYLVAGEPQPMQWEAGGVSTAADGSNTGLNV